MGKFSMKLLFEGQKVVDQSFNNEKELSNMFKDIKKKFGGK